jgi:hypothetical protein
VKNEGRNVLKGGQIKFQDDRWTAPGLHQFVGQRVTIRYDETISFYDRTVPTGPVALVDGTEAFALIRVPRQEKQL